MCSPLFAQFIPVNVTSFKDVFFPLSGYKRINPLHIAMDLITLLFRLILWIPRACYKMCQRPAVEHPLSHTNENFSYPPVLVTFKNKSFYFSNTSMHEYEVQSSFEKARKKFMSNYEWQFSSDKEDFTEKHIPLDVIFNIKAEYEAEAATIKLSTFLQLEAKERKKLIEKYGLHSAIGEEKLKEADKRILEKLTVKDLMYDCAYHKVKLGIMSDKEFQALIYKDVCDWHCFEIQDIVKLRCSYFSKVPAKIPSDWQKMTLVSFYYLDEKDVNQFLEADKTWALLFMSDENLRKIRTDLNETQLRAIWRLCDYDWVDGRNIFAKLSPEFVKANINKIPRYLYRCITDEQFKILDIISLSNNQIDGLLVGNKRVHLLSVEEQNLIKKRFSIVPGTIGSLIYGFEKDSN